MTITSLQRWLTVSLLVLIGLAVCQPLAWGQRCPFQIQNQMQLQMQMRRQQMQQQMQARQQQMQQQALQRKMQMQQQMQARQQQLNRPRNNQPQTVWRQRTNTQWLAQQRATVRMQRMTTMQQRQQWRPARQPVTRGNGLGRGGPGWLQSQRARMQRTTQIRRTTQVRRTVSQDTLWRRQQSTMWERQRRMNQQRAQRVAIQRRQPNVPNRMSGQPRTGRPVPMPAARRAATPVPRRPEVSARLHIKITCGRCHKNDMPNQPHLAMNNNPRPMQLPVVNRPLPQPLLVRNVPAVALPIVNQPLLVRQPRPMARPGLVRQPVNPPMQLPALLLPPAMPALAGRPPMPRPQMVREKETASARNSGVPGPFDPPVMPAMRKDGPQPLVIDALRQEFALPRTPSLISDKTSRQTTAYGPVEPDELFNAPLLPSGARVVSTFVQTIDPALEDVDEEPSLADILLAPPPNPPRPRGLIGAL